MRKKTVLITGGGGFIGSKLCFEFLKKDYHVICLDNFSTGDPRMINQLKSSPDFEFIRHDVIDPIEIDCDLICNLACPASPIHYQKDAIRTIRTNVQGAINMLELAKRLNVPILQTSTSEVYGNPTVHPQVESYYGNVNPIGVRSCYDEGKRCAEALFFDYHRQYGVKIKVVRIFNTYGPGMQDNDGRVVSNFIIQALDGKDITIYGDGSQTRSFCFRDDLVNGLFKMLTTDDSFTGPVNLGNPEEHTVKEVAELIIQMTSSNSKIVYQELPSDDPVRRKPDITLAKTKLNWEPTTSLEDGLRQTIQYFKMLRMRNGVYWHS